MLYVEWDEGCKTEDLGVGLTRRFHKLPGEVEAEVAELSPEEAKQYLKELGIEQTGLDKHLVAGYKLGFNHFFTRRAGNQGGP